MFITFEGPEGSGKTTQMARLAEFLCRAGYQVLTTREPGGTDIGDQIRAILLDLKNTAMHPRTEILLFQASRAQIVEQVIRPQLARAGVVLSDRYADSTLAYQGYGYERDVDQIRAIVEFATGGLKPDLTLLLDLDVQKGLQRRAGGGGWNRLDAYDPAYHERVRQGYLSLAASEPERWVILDAGPPFEQVQQAILETVLSRLAREKRKD
jgi:dTMP kinase